MIKSFEEIDDMYREYAYNNFDEDEKPIEEEGISGSYTGYIDGLEHVFELLDFDEDTINIGILIYTEE